MPPQERTHHNPELWWPELLVPGLQQRWLSQGCWAPGPSEVPCDFQWHGLGRYICSHLNFGADTEKAAASLHTQRLYLTVQNRYRRKVETPVCADKPSSAQLGTDRWLWLCCAHKQQNYEAIPSV